MKNLILATLLLLILATVSTANDGVFYVKGNTLMPLQETQVELRKEVLKFFVRDFIWMEVDVDFTFYNPGRAKTVTVGFVTPPAFGDIDEEKEKHPRIKDFTVNVNGRNIPFEIKRMEETTFQSANQEVSGSDFVYYFPVEFKAGTNKIRHTYRFHGGGSVETQRDFEYQITTGKRWANKQIDDFELQFHPDRGIFYIPLSFSENGKPLSWQINGKGTVSKPQTAFFEEGKPTIRLAQLREGYLSLKEKNFRPDKDISIGEFNWNTGWHTKLCRDEKRCPRPEEIGFNMFLYFRVNPNEQYLKENLEELSRDELRIVRNFPYAIRGYRFNSEKLRSYFSQFFWYQPDGAIKLEDIKLSDNEEKFVKKILALESRK